jgi:hypothetical protein
MSEMLAFPIQATRGKSVRFLVPFMLVCTVVMSWLIYSNLRDNHLQPEWVKVAIPAGVIFFNVFAVVTMLGLNRPSDIVITKSTVTVTPLPILIIDSGEPVVYRLSDFRAVDLDFARSRSSSVSYFVILRGKPDTQDIRLDTPKDETPQSFVQKLRSALNLKGSDNA